MLSAIHIHMLIIHVHMSVTQSCLTLWDPMDCSPTDSSVHGISPGKTIEVSCHFFLQGIFWTQTLNLGLLIAGRFLTLRDRREQQKMFLPYLPYFQSYLTISYLITHVSNFSDKDRTLTFPSSFHHPHLRKWPLFIHMMRPKIGSQPWLHSFLYIPN